MDNVETIDRLVGALMLEGWNIKEIATITHYTPERVKACTIRIMQGRYSGFAQEYRRLRNG